MKLNSLFGRRHALVFACFLVVVLVNGCASTKPQDDSGSSKAPKDAPKDGGSDKSTRSKDDYGSSDEDRKTEEDSEASQDQKARQDQKATQESDEPGAREDRAKRNDTPAPAPSAARKTGDVIVTFTVDRASYKQGEPVSLRLMARNDSAEAIDLQFLSSQQHDFVVKDGDGQVVWRWSNGRAFAQAIVERTLKPGEQLSSTASWNQRTNKKNLVEPGPYKIEAKFLASGHEKPIGPLVIEITE